MTSENISKRLVATRMTRKLVEVITKNTRGLPEGAKCIDVFEDQWTRNIVLVWEHESFKEVPEGCSVPELTLEVTAGGDFDIHHVG